MNQVEAADKIRPSQRRLLILTRPLQARTHHQASLQDRLASDRAVLVPNAAIFAAVAVRLLGRHKLTPNWMEADYDRWSRTFGGDLIAFGQAVLGAGRTGAPSQAMAAKRVREAYVDPARQHDRGIAFLDRLCAAATLDLTVDDSALDGMVQQAVPHLIEGGQV